MSQGELTQNKAVPRMTPELLRAIGRAPSPKPSDTQTLPSAALANHGILPRFSMRSRWSAQNVHCSATSPSIRRISGSFVSPALRRHSAARSRHCNAVRGFGRELSTSAGLEGRFSVLGGSHRLFDGAGGIAVRCRCPLDVRHGKEEHDAHNDREQDAFHGLSPSPNRTHHGTGRRPPM